MFISQKVIITIKSQGKESPECCFKTMFFIKVVLDNKLLISIELNLDKTIKTKASQGAYI